MDEILRSRPMFFSGGGVTFTGGEPTLQFDELLTILKTVKENGINTALESNASHPRLPELFPYIDHLMLDIKHPCDALHNKIVKLGNETIIKNISLAAKTRQTALRIPLINGYNNSGECIEGFINIISEFSNEPGFTLELLRYHEYGKVKWQQHGMEYSVENGFISDDDFVKICGRFTDVGIKLIKT